MKQFPIFYDKLLNAVDVAALECNSKAYLIGNNVLHLLIDDNVSDFKTAEIILCSDNINIDLFYKSLIKNIVINKEVENSPTTYIIISGDIEITFHLEKALTYDVVTKYAFLNYEGLFFDICNRVIIDNFQAINDIQNNIIKSATKWDNDSPIKFAIAKGNFKNISIDNADLEKLLTVDINNLDKNYIELLFNTKNPGTALLFIKNQIPNGINWLFEQLTEYLNIINVQINEDISLENIFTDNQLDLLDNYNKLFDNSTSIEKQETFIRLLLNSPDINIQTPYITQSINVTAMSDCTSQSAWQSFLTEVCQGCSACEDFISNPNNREILCNCVVNNPNTCEQVFRDCCPDCPTGTDPRCPYGVCPECVPSKCANEGQGYGSGGGKQACCCCDSINYTMPIKARCHNRVMVSCNSDGTSPGPSTYDGDGDAFPHCKCDPFPDECTECFDACNKVINGQCDNLSEWFSLPPTGGPCFCYCPDDFKSGETCNLNCAVCGGTLCESSVVVEGGDCSYKISVVPSSDCCGDDVNNTTSKSFNKSVPATACCQFAGQTSYNTDTISWTASGETGEDSVYQHLPIEVSIKDISGDVTIGPTTRTVYGAGIKQQENADGAIDTSPIQTDSSYSIYGISSILTNASALVGVFLDDNDPTLPAPMINIEPYGPNNINTTPELKRVFFIGKNQQTFTPPEGATRLFLGVHDQHNWDDNTGYFNTTISFKTYSFNKLPTSCDCLDHTPIPLKRCTSINEEGTCSSWSEEIPIGMCLNDDLSDCDCSAEYVFDVCGHTFVVTPQNPMLRCCDDIGFGCNCTKSCDNYTTCEPDCDICTKYRNVDEAVRGEWCECWNSHTHSDGCTDCCCPGPNDVNSPDYPCDMISNDPNDPERKKREENGTCCRCSSSNPELCCNGYVSLPDGNCGTYKQYKTQLETLVRNKWAACCSSVPIVPTPAWGCEDNIDCGQKDDCIIGSDTTFPNTCGENRSDQFRYCTTVKNPSSVVLNNGIGLVAYEVWDKIPSIKIQQFKTSLSNKILPNKEFNYGRLENNSKWTKSTPDSPTLARLYYYDNQPLQWLSGSNETGSGWTGKDGIAFRNGPLEHQCFQLSDPPYGSDVYGNKYISFIVPDKYDLSNEFPSKDDVYNIKWFVFNQEDTGLIGDSFDTTTSGQEFLIQGRNRVDEFLQIPDHIFNGEAVPVANPSIDIARNYMNYLENSQYVYLSYQALENNKWNVYLRQIRLSEYDKISQTENTGATIVPLSDLGIDNLIYKVICYSNDCKRSGNKFIANRTVSFQVFSTDGREIYNMGLQGFWNDICSGRGEYDFPKNFVYVKMTQSLVLDKCPGVNDYNSIFYNWKPGDEFAVSYLNNDQDSLFSILTNNSSPVQNQNYTIPLNINGINIYSAISNITWYENNDTSNWGIISGSSYDTLLNFKGVNYSEPVLITYNETGHSTKPIVKVNYNNDVFICYETIIGGTHKITLAGTSDLNSTLPVGYISGKNLDYSLDSFYKSEDFVLKTIIASEGINQLPDMFIDLNDNIHLTWQSNRDRYWEIYYASSEYGFVNERITNYHSQSLKPKIDGDKSGNIYITWHDDRFKNWEIMMAYLKYSRIEPLSQQDPYLASLRNIESGWSHYLDSVPIEYTNNNDSTVCLNNITVDFYFDRMLDNIAFSVNQNDYPFAFIINEAQDDSATKSWSSFGSWSSSSGVYISEEYDSGLFGSNIKSFKISAVNPSNQSIYISFKSSDTQNDSSSSWTNPVDILSYLGSTVYNHSLTSKGKYKTIKIEFSDVSSYPTEVDIVSQVLQRTCIPPNRSMTGFLDLNPVVRIDSTGIVNATSPIPVEYSKQNLTYFVGMYGIDDSGNKIAFPNPKKSISCQSCSNKYNNWDYETCSVSVQIPNDSSNTRFYNAKVMFYTDKDKQHLVQSYNTFDDVNLFTTDGGIPVSSVLTERGVPVYQNQKLNLTLWPVLSNSYGLLCNVKYIVDIFYCYIDEYSQTTECDINNMFHFNTIDWICSCESNRELNGPVNIELLRKWTSSANGYADTRITETTGITNINPMIKIRENGEGVILYESNRIVPWLNLFKTYACVFSVVPSYNMYSSSSESIISSLNRVVVKSDIPIYVDEGLSSSNPQLVDAQNISFDLDQFDNIFMATEVQNDPSVCKMFKNGNAQIIKIHRCGANSKDLSFSDNFKDLITTSSATVAPVIKDVVFKQCINKIRIVDKYVKYSSTYNRKPIAIVDQCNILLEVTGTPEMSSIKIRNESGNWSDWIEFKPLVRDYTAIIPWVLSDNSGLKTITIQSLTYQGLTESYSLSVIADYPQEEYEVEFYRSLNANSEEIKSEYFNEQNRVKTFKNIPVVSMNISLDETKDHDYIFIQIIPSQSYMDSLIKSGKVIDSITFDFVHQGSYDQLNLLAQKDKSSDGKIVFRGAITIHKDNNYSFVDGLAEIVVHMPQLCSSNNSSSGANTNNYNKDIFNQIGKQLNPQEISEDIWEGNRDQYGLIKRQITIRPQEDPYLIFGNPNYWLDKNE